MLLIYKALVFKYLTFYDFFHLVAMLHMGIKKFAKSGFWIWLFRLLDF
jgi:hypothetical protein